MKTRLGSREILSRLKKHAWETASFQIIPFEPGVIKQLLIGEYNNFIPPGHVALLLAGKNDFGDEWKNLVLEELK